MNSRASHVSPNGAPRQQPLAAIILAAGKGTRMNSDLPKVAHEVAGKPIVWWVVNAVRRAGANRIVLVVGYRADAVRSIFEGDDRDITYVTQEQQLGTGHATRCAKDALKDFIGDVLVLAGDGPLLRVETINAMLAKHRATRAAATLATSVIEDPTGYGRIIRDAHNRFAGIVEHKNATAQQRQIREVYPSYACFDAAKLFSMLSALKPDAVSGEYYLTDVPAQLRSKGEVVELVDAVPPEDVLSINTPQELAMVDSILRARVKPHDRAAATPGGRR